MIDKNELKLWLVNNLYTKNKNRFKFIKYNKILDNNITYKESLVENTSYLNKFDNISIYERVYNIVNELKETDIICPICNTNKLKFVAQNIGYSKVCGKKCSSIMIGNKNRGKPKPKEFGEKIRKSKLGVPRPNWVKEKASNTIKQKYENGYISPNKGKQFSEERRKNISKAKKGKTSPWKGITGRYTQETIDRISIASTIQTIERLKDQKGEGWKPAYNKFACEFFCLINNKLSLNGQHALYKGEYYIKELGYHLDYVDFDHKLIIEWDENRHFDSNGNQVEKDIIRQNRIMSLDKFKDFKFVRIKNKDNDKYLFISFRGLLEKLDIIKNQNQIFKIKDLLVA